MAPINNGRVIFNEVPTNFPVPGETTVYDDSDLIDLDTVPLNGGYLVKALYLSIDPYFRHSMRKGYSYSFVLGQPITGYGIARVLRSEKEGINVGDNLQVAELPFQSYTVLSASHPVRIIENKENLPLSLYVGVLGMPGKTAYYGLGTVNPPRKGDTLFVSAACGPVGCTVAQLAKAQGLKVIASAGTDEKVNFLKSVGVNFAFNYHKEKVSDVLSRHGPINIYWDNVGGETLDAAIAASSDRARIIACGAITGYNGGSSYALKNWMQFDEKRLTMSGFLVHELEAESADPDDFYRDMIPLVATGQLKWKEHVYNGLDQAGHAILAVQKGENCGKAIVKLADA